MKKEVRVDYEDIADPQTITRMNERMFLKLGLNVQRDECDIEDDHDRQERVYKIQTRRCFVAMGGKL